MKTKEGKRAISLITLVITIVVMIIISAAVVLTLFGENGIITRAKEARISSDLAVYKEELNMYILNKHTENPSFVNETLTAGKENLVYNTQPQGEKGNIKTVIKSLSDEYLGKLEIIKGELLINTKDKLEIEVAQKLGIEVNPYDIIDGVLISSNGNLLLMDEKTGTLTIPDTVEEIGEGAFANVSGLKTIIIPGTVKEIGTNAFTNNADLTRVVLEEGIEIIGEEAFKECRNLETIELPESLVSIGASAFQDCNKLNNVKIPSKITVIRAMTFYSCDNLSNITLQENLQEIQRNAFLSCSQLDNIYISKSVSNIANSAFNSCTNLVNIEISEENKKYSYSEDNGMLIDTENNNIVFISSVVLNNTTTFSIPEGLTNFNADIRNNTNITTIVIPSSLETIGNVYIFPTTISDVQIKGGNNEHFAVENGCLYNGDKTELIMCFTKNSEAEIADTVTIIKAYSFVQAPNIENVTFDGNITTIEEQVFWGTRNQKLKNIYIGSGVTSINPIFKYGNYYGTVTVDEMNTKYSSENNEIYNKDKTELIGIYHNIQGSYTVRPSVTKIGNSAFYNKNQMTEVLLPEGLKEISNSSFQFCTGLTEIYIPNSVETIATDAFSNSTNLMHIRIDKEPNSIDGAPWGAISWDRAVEWLRPAE